jgi:hypothetical protein
MAQAGDVGAILQLLQGAARQYKPPQFDGQTDVELFIQQFNDVQAANNWNAAAALLHLRTCLTGDAVNCGGGATTAVIFANLRARFGLSEKQARERLSLLEKAPGQTLQALSVEAERLTAVAYPQLADAVRTTLAVDAFTRALDDIGVKRHLLVAGAATMADTVRCAEEYLQVAGRLNKQHKQPAKQLHLAAANTEIEAADKIDKVIQRLDRLMTLMEQQASGQTRHPQNGGKNTKAGSAQQSKQPRTCYGCGSPSHLIRNCPANAVNGSAPDLSGNADCPRQ